jgi:hypothetical protein
LGQANSRVGIGKKKKKIARGREKVGEGETLANVAGLEGGSP